MNGINYKEEMFYSEEHIAFGYMNRPTHSRTIHNSSREKCKSSFYLNNNIKYRLTMINIANSTIKDENKYIGTILKRI